MTKFFQPSRVRPTYRRALELVALNDNPGDLDPESVAATVAVGLVADLFCRPVEQVAADVVRVRRAQ